MLARYLRQQESSPLLAGSAVSALDMAMPGQHSHAGSAAAPLGALALGPGTQSAAPQDPWPGSSVAAERTAPQSMEYPSVADLERAGERPSNDLSGMIPMSSSVILLLCRGDIITYSCRGLYA